MAMQLSKCHQLIVLFSCLLIAVTLCQSNRDRSQRVSNRLCPHLYNPGAYQELHQRFSTGQLSAICSRHSDWEITTRRRNDAQAPRLSRKQFGWLKDVWSCQNLACMCKLDATAQCGASTITAVDDRSLPQIGTLQTSDGSILPDIPGLQVGDFSRKKRQITKLRQAIRKEYRMMSETERNRYHAAMNAAKTQKIEGLSKYDLLTLHHTAEYSPGAHFGAALLPFHREMMKQHELVLRTIDPSVAIPYWDSTLDEPLPDPADSILWTDKFYGNGDGEVTNGPFASWVTSEDLNVDHLSPNRRIVRSAGTSPFGGLYRKSDIDRIMAVQSYENLTYCVDPFFELVHGTLHMWIGGHMATLRISPNDPTFFGLHTFVDYIWEEWRQRRQTAEQREADYPAADKACAVYHKFDHSMQPFGILNRDGLSNRYTNELYRYERSPTCTGLRPDCGSEYLCNSPRCVSKVRPSGNCTGYNQQSEICYQGQCVQGRCSSVQQVATTPATIPTTRRTTTPRTTRRPTTTTRRTTTTRTTTRRPVTTTTPRRNAGTTPSDPFAAGVPTTKITSKPDTDFVIDSFTSTSRTPVSRQPFVAASNISSVWFPVTVFSVRSSVVMPFRDGRIMAEHADGTLLEGVFMNPFDARYYSGASAIRMQNPYEHPLGIVHAELTVLDETSKPCVAMCLKSAEVIPWQYTPCVAKVSLSRDPRRSDNLAFTPYQSHVLQLAWAATKKLPDPFMFLCHAVAGTITGGASGSNSGNKRETIKSTTVKPISTTRRLPSMPDWRATTPRRSPFAHLFEATTRRPSTTTTQRATTTRKANNILKDPGKSSDLESFLIFHEWW